MKQLAVDAAIVIVTGLAILMCVEPQRVERADCFNYREYSTSLGFAYSSCDSPKFLVLAASPEALLEPGEFRQSRPFYIWLAAALGRGFILARGFSAEPFNSIGTYFWYYYAAYVTLNLFAFLGVVSTYRRLVSEQATWHLAAAALGSMLIFNEVVIAFLWTPHTQMMILLAPLACVWGCRRALMLTDTGLQALALGLIGGVGSLAYGAFVVFPIAIVAGYMLAGARQGRLPWATRLSASTAVGAAIPLAAWLVVVISNAGSFYSAEVEKFHHFVWPYNSAKNGGLVGLLTATKIHLFFSYQKLWLAGWPVFLTFWTSLIVAAVAGVRWHKLSESRKRTLAASGIVSVLMFLMFLILGKHPTRLAWHVLLPLLVIAAICFDCALRSFGRVGRVTASVILVGGALGWVSFELYHPYPFGRRALAPAAIEQLRHSIESLLSVPGHLLPRN